MAVQRPASATAAWARQAAASHSAASRQAANPPRLAGASANSSTIRAAAAEQMAPAAEQGSPGGSAPLTPRSAHLRWLEENPEMAFGGGTKLAASPQRDETAPARKLTAEERHLMDWQEHL